MKSNPKAAIDALVTPGPLTLGKVALLAKIDSPILVGNIDSLPATLTALYVIEQPLSVTAASVQRLEEAALIAYDDLTPDEYRARVGRALDAVSSFFEMLPRPSPDVKKNSGTDGAPNSPNGSAGPTTTGSNTSSGNSRPSRPRSSGAAGSRGREAARRARS